MLISNIEAFVKLARAAGIFVPNLYIYMSVPVTATLFSMHSMFPIHAMVIWLLNNNGEGINISST